MRNTFTLRGNEDVFTRFKKRLELLEKVVDFQSIGNFQKLLKNQPFNFERFINTIKSTYFSNKPKDFIHWLNDMEEFNSLFNGMFNIYTNFNLFREAVQTVSEIIIKALLTLYDFPDFRGKRIEKINSIIFKFFLDDYGWEMEDNFGYINNDLLNDLVKKNNADISFLSGLSRIKFYYDYTDDPLRDNASIYDYKSNSPFYSWEVIPTKPYLNVEPKTLGYSTFLNFRGENTLKHYILSLSHELFHHLTYYYPRLARYPYRKAFIEILTELRKFAFFYENLKILIILNH